jgi:hypothetical protein
MPMPDLSIEYVRTCSSNLHWQKKYHSNSVVGLLHTVSFGPVYGRRYSHDYSCDCSAGRRGLICWHIKQAAKDRCGWGVEAFSGSRPQPNPNNTCPQCGKPTEVIKVGV